jgi:magnesium transporter
MKGQKTILDQLSEIESNHRIDSIQALMNDTFNIRYKLLKLRKTIVPMHELLYQAINSERIEGIKDHLVYFTELINFSKPSIVLENVRCR